MRHLHSQSLRAQMEVIIVCPSLAELDAGDEVWQDFYEVRCIEVGVIRSTGEVRQQEQYRPAPRLWRLPRTTAFPARVGLRRWSRPTAEPGAAWELP